jgi:hypothetical protein
MPQPENLVWPPSPPSHQAAPHAIELPEPSVPSPSSSRNRSRPKQKPRRPGKKYLWVAVLALVLLVSALLAGPYWKLHRFKGALLSLDANYIAESVDFGQLRANLKASNRADILQRAMGEGGSPNLMRSAIVSSLGDSMIDSVVTPEGLAVLAGEINSLISSSPAGLDAAAAFRLNVEKWYALSRAGYTSPNSFEVSLPYSDRSSVIFVLSRRSFFWWELSDIQLPSD